MDLVRIGWSPSWVRYGAPLSKVLLPGRYLIEGHFSSEIKQMYPYTESLFAKISVANAMMIVDRGKIKGTNDPNNGPKWLLLATHELFIRRATKASPSSGGSEPLIWTILNYTQMTTSHRLKGYFEYTLSQHTRIQNTNTGKTML